METLVLYGPTLRFSFLLDDSYDLIVVRQTSYQELLLRPLPGFSYYRPLTFILYKFIHDLWDGTEPSHYHLFSILLHALNALLLALLVRRVAGIVAAALSASLFIAFPFAYQAVQIVCSLPHLLVTTALLGMLVLWELGTEELGHTGRLLRCTAITAALAAPGFHETGVLSGTLLVAWSIWRSHAGWRRALQRNSGWLIPALFGNGTYLALWFWGFDKPGSRPVTLLDRLENLGFWSQAVAYPLTRQLTTLLDTGWLARHSWQAVIGTALVGGTVALIFHTLGTQLRLALGTLGLSLLTFLPAILFLPYHGYVEDGPRLLYPAAPGIAAFWGLLPRAGWHWRQGRWLGAMLGMLVIVITLTQSIAFLERRTELGLLASHAQEAVVATARANPHWPLAVVHAPAWLALHHYEYPLGHFGMNAQPEYLGFDALLEARLGWRQPVQSLVIGPPPDQGWYTIGPHGRPGNQAQLDALRLSGWVICDIQPRKLSERRTL
ncbi:hypothetical protein NET03_03165 [Thermomicrobium sp. CFH 73360]|uniref:hypothetical protein n=1 Tax=Thermomicrobium sp. CFH 73360 TaxID=2951987 RepID=UPI0020767A85|nr:hypothetical protein [Thermomicrobium sp. CFH 73360]MCM8745524.1 hypothetical protein [Thermomicrobium sp. CFH 73360]